MSTILIDRRTAALLGQLAAEPAATAAPAAPRTGGSRRRATTTRPAPITAPENFRRTSEVTERRAAGGGSRLRRRLRCESGSPRRGAVTARSSAPTRARSVPGHRPALHLTRRGRVVALLLLFLVLTVAFSVGRVTSTALGSQNGSAAEVVVQRGDTLWSIAERTNPDADPRSVSADLMAVNGLASPSLEVGQHLRLP